ncbi:MAG: hypothetical protein N2Z74_06585 [Syntrophales bacterium]|nr:hypothetical protein [Syntrophales bacterium]
MEYHGEGGLRAFLTRYADKMRSVACDDPGVLMDLDTPAQYAAVKTPS